MSARAQSRLIVVTVSYQGPRSLPGCFQSWQNPTNDILTRVVRDLDRLGWLLSSRDKAEIKVSAQLSFYLEALLEKKFFFNMYLFNLFFGYAGSSLLRGFLLVWRTGLLFIAAHRLPVAVASLAEEHRI